MSKQQHVYIIWGIRDTDAGPRESFLHVASTKEKAREWLSSHPQDIHQWDWLQIARADVDGDGYSNVQKVHL